MSDSCRRRWTFSLGRPVSRRSFGASRPKSCRRHDRTGCHLADVRASRGTFCDMNAQRYSRRLHRYSTKILLPLLLAWGTAQGEEWVSLTKTIEDGQQIDVLVETPIIRIDEDIRDTATKREYPLQKLPGGQSNHFVTEVWHFDCRKQLSQLIAIESQRLDGTTVSMTAHQDESTWRPAATEWPPKQVLDFVCSWKPPTGTT